MLDASSIFMVFKLLYMLEEETLCEYDILKLLAHIKPDIAAGTLVEPPHGFGKTELSAMYKLL